MPYITVRISFHDDDSYLDVVYSNKDEAERTKERLVAGMFEVKLFERVEKEL